LTETPRRAAPVLFSPFTVPQFAAIFVPEPKHEEPLPK
jgi:hypothetical protein